MILLGLLFLSLFFIRFSVEIKLVLDNQDLNTGIKFGIGRFLVAIPHRLLTRMMQRIRQRNFGTLEGAVRGSKLALRFSENVLQKVLCFDLEVLIGMGDPFWTALGVGGIWSILSPLLCLLDNSRMPVAFPSVRVLPDYENTKVQASLYCIFQFRLGQVIINELKRVIT